MRVFLYRPLKVSIMSLGSVLGALTWWSINFLNVCQACYDIEHVGENLHLKYKWNERETNGFGNDRYWV